MRRRPANGRIVADRTDHFATDRTDRFSTDHTDRFATTIAASRELLSRRAGEARAGVRT